MKTDLENNQQKINSGKQLSLSDTYFSVSSLSRSKSGKFSFVSVLYSVLFFVTLLFAFDARCETGTTSKGNKYTEGPLSYTDSNGRTHHKSLLVQGEVKKCPQKNCSSVKEACELKRHSKTVTYTKGGKTITKTIQAMDRIASGNTMKAGCLAEQAENGCYNPVPVSCAGSYSGQGFRPNGAGGNPTPRNHNGSDIGAKACAQANGGKYEPINVYSAADGIVRVVKTAGGSGRTIVVETTKGCNVTSGTHPSFHTIYRHLLQAKVGVGDAVDKGAVIGIMGGSNAGSGGKPGPCDNKIQSGWPGYSHDSNACSTAKAHYGTESYDIHLHMEILDGEANASATVANNAILDPSCSQLQEMCGSCANDAAKCRGGQQGFSDGTAGQVDGTVVDTTDGEEAAKSACSYADYVSNDGCVFCDLFKTMFNAASQIALMADNGLLTPTLNLVKIGFLIWLAIYLLKQLASFKATNSGELTKGILFQGFRVAVVALILSSTASLFYVMDLTLNPVMMTGLNFIKDMNRTSSCPKDADYMKNIKGYSAEKGYNDAGSTKGGLSTELGESIICGVKNMEDSTSLLMKLGNFSVCLGFNDHPWILADAMGIKIDLPHLGYVTTGIFLWLAGLALLLTFPWCLVDCILQLCIAAALVPCAIGAYAFKITSKYMKIIWDFFMNAMFNFVFMALIIYIINQQLQSWLNIDLNNGAEPPHEIFISFSGLAWYGMGFVRVAAICFFCYVFFDEAKSMAEKFASSPGLGGGKGIGRMVGGTMADAAGKAGGAALHTTGKVASAAGAGLNYAVGNQYRSMKNHAIGALASRFGKNASVTGADGKTVAHEGSFRMFGRDIKFSATKGDDGKWSLTRETHKRSQSDKAFEKVLDKDGNEVRDENGNVKYRARHRIFGKVTGYEDMIATKDEDGNLVYSTADGKSTFRLDENGQIAAYKTRFTRSYLGLGKAVEKTKKQYGTNRVVSTATSRTTERTDALGNVTEAHTEMKDFNLFNRDLIRKDGTINIDTFNEMQKNMANPEQAAKVLVSKAMEARGIKLDLSNKDTQVSIDDNGRVTINQVTKETIRQDGKDIEQIVETKNIQAVMIGDQMFVAVETTDKDGNMTLNESNGIFHTVQTATKQSDGTFRYDFDGGFSEHALSNNSFMSPLNHKGEWGNNINRDKAMAGFSQDHFNKYIDKLKLKQMSRTMSTGEYNRSAEAGERHSHIHQGKFNSLDEAKQNMTNVQRRKQEHGTEETSIKDLDKRIGDEKKKETDINTELQNNLKDIQNVREELEQERTHQERLENELKMKNEAAIKDEEENARIEKEITEAKEKEEKLKEQAIALDRQKEELEAKIKTAREEIERLQKQKEEFYVPLGSDVTPVPSDPNKVQP